MRKRVWPVGTTSFLKSVALFGCCAVAPLCGAVPASAQEFRLPDSDQRKCYQEVGLREVACAGTGQDGAYIHNPLNYSVDGEAVTDNNTGLVWQKEDDGIPYNWYEATGTYHSY